jgi:AraC-like DNA-binding protein
MFANCDVKPESPKITKPGSPERSGWFLQSARNLMLNGAMDAASAAFEVGYESPSQFNREYSRFFGQPPVRDVRALRESGTRSSESMTQQIA